MRRAAAALLLCSWAAADPVVERADRIVEAFRAGNTAALKKLVIPYEPDRWTVADALCERGEHDAALAWLGTVPRLNPSLEKLPAYIESRRAGPLRPDGRALVIRAASLRGDEGLAALDAISPEPKTVLGVYVAHRRAVTLLRMRRYQDARATYATGAERALAIGWLERAGALYDLGASVAFGTGDYRDAIDLWQSGLEIQTARGYGRGIARAKERIAAMYVTLGEGEKALPLLEEALPVLRELKDHRQEKNAHAVLANYYTQQGDLEKAREHALAGLQAIEQVGNPLYTTEARVHVMRIEAAMGSRRREAEVYAECVRLLRETGDSHDLSEVLPFYARTLETLGEFAAALDALDEALRLCRARQNLASEGRVHVGLASIYYHVGDGDAAFGEMERALECYRASGFKPGMANALQGLGMLQARFHDDADAAQNLLLQALPLLEEVGDRNATARCLTELGDIHRRYGRLDAASVCHDRALRLRRTMGQAEPLATQLGYLADLASVRGDHASAEKCIDEALALLGEATSPVQEAILRGVRAQVKLRAGAHLEALADARQAALVLGHSGEDLSEWRAATARETQGEIHATGIAAAERLGDAGAALWFLEAGRGRTLLQILRSREALRGTVLPPELAEAEAAAEVSVTRAGRALRAALESGDEGRATHARTALDEARRDLQAATARPEREAKRAAGLLHPEVLDANAIAHLLRKNQVLVSYGFFDAQRIPFRRTVAVVVRRKETRLVDLGDSVAIADVSRALRLDSDAFDVEGVRGRLRELVVDPLGLEAGVEVLVSPDGPLALVPFGLLMDSRSVTHVPSGTAYALLRQEATLRGKGVLALGNPHGEATPAATGTVTLLRADELLRPLEGAEKEVEAIGAERTLLGAQATEGALRVAAAERTRWRAIHFACHGLLDSERPMFSALALAPSEEDDGFLTVLDVLRMKLPADLAVLSACRSGRGRMVYGEGVLGFVRAFLFAGAPRVIVSAWKVDDDATRELMVKFYALWKDGGMSTAEALRAAQEHVRTFEGGKWSHPHYWAAWQLWGLPD